MQRERPTAVLVMAILNFVVGGFNLLALLCGGGALALVLGFASSLPPGPGGQPNPLQEMGKVFKDIPGYIPVLIGQTILGFVLAIVLIVAGFGMLKMAPWSRTLCNIYAGVTLIVTLGATVYTLTVVNPAMARWQEDFQKKFPGAGAGGQQDPVTQAATAVCGAIFAIAYAVALLIVMNLPNVSAAFAGVRTQPDLDSDRVPDDYGRRYGGREEDDPGGRYQKGDEDDRVQGG
jgi:hypothetical protein